MAGIQAFDARAVLTLAAVARGRTACGWMFARVRVLVANIFGAKQVVVATVLHADAMPAGTGVDANVHGAEQPVVAIRVGRARSRRTCLGAGDTAQGDETTDRRDKRRPLPNAK